MYLGVIEGFYGKPWSYEQRIDLFNRISRLSFNSYMYAPKDDFYHRHLWQKLYPDEKSKDFRKYISCCEKNNILFCSFT